MRHRNQYTGRTHCGRGHLLADPNLVEGEKKRNVRKCRACNQAAAYISRHPETRGNLQAVADDRYARLMGKAVESGA